MCISIYILRVIHFVNNGYSFRHQMLCLCSCLFFPHPSKIPNLNPGHKSLGVERITFCVTISTNTSLLEREFSLIEFPLRSSADDLRGL